MIQDKSSIVIATDTKKTNEQDYHVGTLINKKPHNLTLASNFTVTLDHSCRTSTCCNKKTLLFNTKAVTQLTILRNTKKTQLTIKEAGHL